MSQLSVKWIFILERDYTVDVKPYLPPDFSADIAFEDRHGNRWLEISKDGKATVLAPYAWDGCTPKYAVWDIVLGTPDGIPNVETKRPKAYYASLVHDVLYQFLDADLPISRAGADHIFLDLLSRDGFGPRWIYYAAVRVFGGGFRLFTGWKRGYRGRKIIAPPARPALAKDNAT